LKYFPFDTAPPECQTRIMPTRASKRRDFTQIAKSVFDAATGDGPAILPPGAPPANDTRNQAAVALSKLGASKGGKARAASLSAAKRKAIAKKAAKKRWGL
jgi:hypothetical protein